MSKAIRYSGSFLIALSALCVPVSTTGGMWTIQDQKTDKKLLDQLGPSSDLGGYEIRAPKGYSKVVPPNQQAGSKFIGWTGKQRADGSTPMLQIILMKPPAGQELPSQEQYLEIMLQGVKARRQDWSQSEPEQVKVNGITFLKATWTGAETTQGRKMQGVMYVAIDKQTFIQLHTQDKESEANASLKLGEAAMTTFKRK